MQKADLLSAALHVSPQIGDVFLVDLVGPGRHGAALAVEDRGLEAGEIVLGELAQVERDAAARDQVAAVTAGAQLMIDLAALLDVVGAGGTGVGGQDKSKKRERHCERSEAISRHSLHG